MIYKFNTYSCEEIFACRIYLLFCGLSDPLRLAFPRLVYLELDAVTCKWPFAQTGMSADSTLTFTLHCAPF